MTTTTTKETNISGTTPSSASSLMRLRMLSPASPALTTTNNNNTTPAPRRNKRPLTTWIRILPRDLSKPQCVLPHIVSSPSSDNNINDANYNQSHDLILMHSSIDNLPPSTTTTTSDDIATKTVGSGFCLVKPQAIGKHVSPRVTLETAKLVSTVSNAMTEDWVKYFGSFTHLEWMDQENNNNESSGHKIWADLVQHVTPKENDEQAPFSGVVLSLGKSSTTDINNWILQVGQQIWSQQQENNDGGILQLSKKPSLVELSVLQITRTAGGGEVMTDLLLSGANDSNKNGAPPAALQIRHLDADGAIVMNLTQKQIDGVSTLRRELEEATQHVTVLGHVVYTLTIHHEQLPGSTECSTSSLQFVDLDDTALSTLSAVGQLLKTNTGSWRNTLLTKVLQRCMEPLTTKVVLLGTISSLAESYDATVSTVQYLHRLLPSFRMATSPPLTSPQSTNGGKKNNNNNQNSMTSPQRMHQLATHPSLLGNTVSDPRQRLAKLAPAPTVSKSIPLNYSIDDNKDNDDDDRPETNYDDVDPFGFQQTYYNKSVTPRNAVSPVRSAAKRKDDSNNDDDLYDFLESPQNTSASPIRSVIKSKDEDNNLYDFQETFFNKLPRNVASPVRSAKNADDADDYDDDPYGVQPTYYNKSATQQNLTTGSPTHSAKKDYDDVDNPYGLTFNNKSMTAQNSVSPIRSVKSNDDKGDHYGQRTEYNKSLSPPRSMATASPAKKNHSVDFDYATPLRSPLSPAALKRKNESFTSQPETPPAPTLHGQLLSEQLSADITDNEDALKLFAADQQELQDGIDWILEESQDETSSFEVKEPSHDDILQRTVTIQQPASQNSIPMTAGRMDSKLSVLTDDQPSRRMVSVSPRHEARSRSQRPRTYRSDSKLSVMTEDADPVEGPQISTPTPLRSALKNTKRRPAPVQERRSTRDLDEPRPTEISFARQPDEVDSSKVILGGLNNMGTDVLISDLTNLEDFLTPQQRPTLLRLRKYIERQQSILLKIKDDYTQAQHQWETTEANLSEQLETELRLAEKEKKRSLELKEELTGAKGDSANLVLVAEEAVRSSEELDQARQRLELELESVREAAAQAEYEKELAVAEVDRLEREMKNTHETTNGDPDGYEAIIGELTAQIERIGLDRDRLEQELFEDRRELDTLRLESQGVTESSAQLQTANVEIERLKHTNGELANKLSANQADNSTKTRQREADFAQLQLQVQSLERKVTASQRRVEEERISKESIQQMFEEEKMELMRKIFNLESDRDHLKEIRDSNLSEMEKLKVERLMLETQNKSNSLLSTTVDRLRTKIATQANELSEIQNDMADRLNEKDSLLQKVKIQVHQLQLELRGVRNDLISAQEEVELARQGEEGEHVRLIAAQTETARLNKQLMALRESTDNSASNNAELQTKLEEYRSERDKLTEQLERQSEDLDKAKVENHVLREKLTSARDMTRSQLLEIQQKKRDLDATLESERSKRQVAESENVRLNACVERLLQERDDDQNGLGGFHEKMESLLAETASASAKATQLQKELNDALLRESDLADELKLARLNSNEDVIRAAQEELEALRLSNSRRAGTIEHLESERGATHFEVESLRQRLEEMEEAKAIAEAKSELTSAKKRELESLHRQSSHEETSRHEALLRQFREDKEALERSNEELTRTLEALKMDQTRNIDEHQSVIVKLRMENTDLEEQTAELASKWQSAHDALDELQRQMEVERQDRLSYIAAPDAELELLRENEFLRQELASASAHGTGDSPDLQHERQLRVNAEELACTMATKLKETVKSRDRIIRKLKTNLIQTSEQKEAEISSLRLRLFEQERAWLSKDDDDED